MFAVFPFPNKQNSSISIITCLLIQIFNLIFKLLEKLTVVFVFENVIFFSPKFTFHWSCINSGFTNFYTLLHVKHAELPVGQPPAVAFTAFADAWPRATETEIGAAPYAPLAWEGL